jgi:tetratricopeptide (TPR) repeat protein
LFTEAIAISPLEHVLYSNRSGAYASAKDFSKAKVDAEKCISLNPSWPKGYTRLGVACHYLKESSDAHDAYTKGLKIDPENQAMKEGLAKVQAERPPEPPTKRKREGWDDAAPPPPPPSGGPPAKLKKPEPLPISAMNRTQLIEALYSSGPFKEKNEIVKRLQMYPANPLSEKIDDGIQASELVMKQYKTPQAFLCHRCDRAKISSHKVRLQEKHDLCGSCYDHLIRCVIAFRSVPEYQRPEKCIHEIPRSYQKKYR